MTGLGLRRQTLKATTTVLEVERGDKENFVR